MSGAICLLVLAIAVMDRAQTHPHEYGKNLSKIAGSTREKCVKKTGVDVQDIENCEKGNFKEDVKLKKYMGCVGVELGIIDPKTENLNMDRIYDLTPPHLKADLPEFLKDCDIKNDSYKEAYEKQFNLIKCFYKLDPEHFEIV